IKELGKEKTLILSTHILQEVEDICEDVIIISKGKIVANSSVAGLKKGNGVLFTVKAGLEKIQSLFPEKEFLSVRQHSESTVIPENYNSFLVEMEHEKPELVFSKLASTGLEVREIKIYHRSLESIFEELTRN
ncbi:MAG: hypothetical protein K8R21_06415, partial [Leptospira sp.]|nr:hypothetical protein [Leptospira sp.]